MASRKVLQGFYGEEHDQFNQKLPADKGRQNRISIGFIHIEVIFDFDNRNVQGGMRRVKKELDYSRRMTEIQIPSIDGGLISLVHKELEEIVSTVIESSQKEWPKRGIRLLYL